MRWRQDTARRRCDLLGVVVCRAAPDIEIRIAMDVEAVGAARRFVRGSACALHGTEVLDTSVLLASELVADAVRHASPPVRLELRCDEATGVEIRVSDGSARAPCCSSPTWRRSAVGGCSWSTASATTGASRRTGRGRWSGAACGRVPDRARGAAGRC